MEIDIYKEKQHYYAKINGKIVENKDYYCLGLSIAHEISDKYENKLESLILKKGKNIEEKKAGAIKNQIKNSSFNKGYEVKIKS